MYDDRYGVGVDWNVDTTSTPSQIDYTTDTLDTLQETAVDGTGYIQQLDSINSLLLFIIFALGVIGGLIFSKILWGRVG